MERKNSFSYQPFQSFAQKYNANSYGSSTFSKLDMKKSMTLNFPLNELPQQNEEKNPQTETCQARKEKLNLVKSSVFCPQTSPYNASESQTLKKKTSELISQTEALLTKLSGVWKIKNGEGNKSKDDSPGKYSSVGGMGRKNRPLFQLKKQNSFSIQKKSLNFHGEKNSISKGYPLPNNHYTPQAFSSAHLSQQTESTLTSETKPMYQHSKINKINKIKKGNLWTMQEKKISQPELQHSPVNDNNFKDKNRMSAPLPKIQKQPTLENFNIIEKIGKGAYGDVFLAQEKQTRTLYVLKTLLKAKVKQEKLEEHLFREIKLQMYMAHKHLTPLYGFFDDQTKIYLILEYMPDGNLSHLYRKKKVSEAKVSSIVKQVCEGLNYMHTENVLHRDIKPENLFVHEDYVKIGDFGCAVFSHTMRKTMVGCLAYISPEQLLNSDYDEKIDVWSVGILAFELLTGKPPFEQDIIKINRNEQEPKLSALNFPKDLELSSSAIDFVQKLLRQQPTERMDLRNALKHPFLAKSRKNQFN